MSITSNDREAVSLWGSAYADIPKSVFATIAWHLANVASGTADEDGAAEARFLEEWEALLAHGISKPSKKLRAALAAARGEGGAS